MIFNVTIFNRFHNVFICFQIISVKVRSAIHKDVDSEAQFVHPCDTVKSGSKVTKEMDYCSMINNHLPEDIRVIGWTPVNSEFSARFSCTSRTYRYFFVQKNNLNILAMQKAAGYFVGTHDFRNLCKMDVVNVDNFVREIYSCKIVKVSSSSINRMHNQTSSVGEVWMLEIKGIAFLWHMVRCIMAVLFLVGQNKELPEIVQQLLDVNKCPAKPSYQMAPERPLVLHHCEFNKLQIFYTARTLWNLTIHFKSLWERHIIAANRAMNSLLSINEKSVRLKDFEELIQHFSGHKNMAPVEQVSGELYTTETSHDERSEVYAQQLKRKRISYFELPALEDTNGNCKWSDALIISEYKYGAVPKIGEGLYIPLMKRSREDTLATKKANVQSVKKKVPCIIIQCAE